MKLKVYNQKGEATGEIEAPESVLGLKPNNDLIHQAMVAQMSNERKVLAHTKDRGEVRGGGRKPWRQKGTGRARAGSSRSPIWKGGGVTFGPTNARNFKKNINKKMRQLAMLQILSDKFANKKAAIIEKFDFNDFKTKDAEEVIKAAEGRIFKHKGRRSVLVINDKDKKARYSFRNLEGVRAINSENINILDLLAQKYLLINKKTIESLIGVKSEAKPQESQKK